MQGSAAHSSKYCTDVNTQFFGPAGSPDRFVRAAQPQEVLVRSWNRQITYDLTRPLAARAIQIRLGFRCHTPLIESRNCHHQPRRANLSKPATKSKNKWFFLTPAKKLDTALIRDRVASLCCTEAWQKSISGTDSDLRLPMSRRPFRRSPPRFWNPALISRRLRSPTRSAKSKLRVDRGRLSAFETPQDRDMLSITSLFSSAIGSLTITATIRPVPFRCLGTDRHTTCATHPGLRFMP
jgi:hypothetical protein